MATPLALHRSPAGSAYHRLLPGRLMHRYSADASYILLHDFYDRNFSSFDRAMHLLDGCFFKEK